MDTTRPGPLAGLTVVEAGGIGPTPFAGLLLAQMGAEVVRLQRPGEAHHGLDRGKRLESVDLKSLEGRSAALALIEGADALIEGFRPGVLEGLGLGSDAALGRNPRLV